MHKYFQIGIILAGLVLFVGCGSMELEPDQRRDPVFSPDSGQAEGTSHADQEEIEDRPSQDGQEGEKEQAPELAADQAADRTQTDQGQGHLVDPNPLDEEAGDLGEKKELQVVNQFTNQEDYNPDIDIEALSQEGQSWGFKRNQDHRPVQAYYQVEIDKYGTYYLGNTQEKVLYLTFDEGYENGFTPAILDTLKQKGVKAAFFITGSYLKHNPDLVKRMKAEGHLVANHSQNHPDFTEKTDEEVVAEVAQVGEKFKEVTGQEIDPFFRFPSGRYTERNLYLIRKMGYRNIFWSMAYKDWEVDNQPGKDYAYNHVMENHHPGAIILLHAVSRSNAEALADIIDSLDQEGYRFASLYELE